VAVFSLAIFGAPDAIETEVYQERANRFVTIERPGLPPVVLLASEEVVARDDLKGTWQAVYLEHQGEPRPDLAADLQMKFTRGRLELMQRGREPTIVAYSLGLRDHPPRFTWVLHGPYGILLQKGVYWLEGDTLMLCLSPVDKRRATEFLTQPGDGRTLFVLTRVATGAEEPSLSAAEWMSLGVFGLTKPGQPGASVLVRLAVNREGQVTGEAYDPQTNAKQPLVGSVDRGTERVFWTIGDDQATVMETGLAGLTQMEGQVLLHHEDGRSETWAMSAVFPPSPD
jgi:uncharacterized protein (TIGR03067 family)